MRYLVVEGHADRPASRILVDDPGTCRHDPANVPLFHVYREPARTRHGKLWPTTTDRLGAPMGGEHALLWRAVRCPESLTTSQFRQLQDDPRTIAPQPYEQLEPNDKTQEDPADGPNPHGKTRVLDR